MRSMNEPCVTLFFASTGAPRFNRPTFRVYERALTKYIKIEFQYTMFGASNDVIQILNFLMSFICCVYSVTNSGVSLGTIA